MLRKVAHFVHTGDWSLRISLADWDLWFGLKRKFSIPTVFEKRPKWNEQTLLINNIRYLLTHSRTLHRNSRLKHLAYIQSNNKTYFLVYIYVSYRYFLIYTGWLLENIHINKYNKSFRKHRTHHNNRCKWSTNIECLLVFTSERNALHCQHFASEVIRLLLGERGRFFRLLHNQAWIIWPFEPYEFSTWLYTQPLERGWFIKLKWECTKWMRSVIETISEKRNFVTLSALNNWFLISTAFCYTIRVIIFMIMSTRPF